MLALKVFLSPVWLLLHKLSSPHYRYIRKMRRGDRLPADATLVKEKLLERASVNELLLCKKSTSNKTRYRQ
jgi:hypothetical protein